MVTRFLLSLGEREALRDFQREEPQEFKKKVI